MPKTIYASFRDPQQAENAAGALLDEGVKPENISLVVKDPNRQDDGLFGNEQLDYSSPTTLTGPEIGNEFDPLGNYSRSGPARILGGNLTDSDLNPATNDYPPPANPHEVDGTSFSSTPPDQHRNFNRGIEDDGYNQGYQADVQREDEEDLERDRKRRDLPHGVTEYPLDERLGGDATIGEPTDHVATGMGKEDDPSTSPYTPHSDRQEPGDRASATSSRDVASGMAKGAGVGLGVGAVAALAAFMVPGIGMVMGGGPLSTALASLAAGTGAGAAIGGLAAHLKESGVSPDDADRYEASYRSGGAVLAVTLVDDMQEDRVRRLLDGHGASDVNLYNKRYMS
jgi:hypothetical protein